MCLSLAYLYSSPLLFSFIYRMSQVPKPNKKATYSDKKAHYTFGEAGGTSWTASSHSKSFVCRIDGVPKPQARNFATTKGKNSKVHLWNPSKPLSDSFQKCFKEALQSAGATALFQKTGLPVKLSIKFYFPRPRSHYVYSGSELVLAQNAPFFVTKTPDLDNLLKLVLDAIQDICYQNDCNVVHIDGAKLWNHCQRVYRSGQADEGYTIIKVLEILDQTYTRECPCLYCKSVEKQAKQAAPK